MNQIQTVLHEGIAQITVFIGSSLFNNLFGRQQISPRIQEAHPQRV